MYAWEQIQQTIEYMEGHLGEEINIEKLAEVAALSPFYYQRLFKRLVKKPVAEYMKLRRLSKAIEELTDKSRRILDIALELGFSSHEHFTRSFKNAFAMTPEEYRNNPKVLNRMTKPELLLNYTLIDEGVPLITEGIVLEVNRKKLENTVQFAGFKKELPVSFIEGLGTESGEDPLYTLWEEFHEKKPTAAMIDADAEEIGVTLPGSAEGYFSYFAGAIVNGKNLQKEYFAWELPAGEYVVCMFEAENFEALVMDALYKAEQYLYGIWLPNHKLQTDIFCAERYQSHTPETTKMEVWLKIV